MGSCTLNPVCALANCRRAASASSQASSPLCSPLRGIAGWRQCSSSSRAMRSASAQSAGFAGPASSREEGQLPTSVWCAIASSAHSFLNNREGAVPAAPGFWFRFAGRLPLRLARAGFFILPRFPAPFSLASSPLQPERPAPRCRRRRAWWRAAGANARPRRGTAPPGRRGGGWVLSTARRLGRGSSTNRSPRARGHGALSSRHTSTPFLPRRDLSA